MFRFYESHHQFPGTCEIRKIHDLNIRFPDKNEKDVKKENEKLNPTVSHSLEWS